MKAGIVTMQKAGKQILKDIALLQEKRVKHMVWIFAKGAKVAPKVIRTLLDNGIEVIEQ